MTQSGASCETFRSKLSLQFKKTQKKRKSFGRNRKQKNKNKRNTKKSNILFNNANRITSNPFFPPLTLLHICAGVYELHRRLEQWLTVGGTVILIQTED